VAFTGRESDAPYGIWGSIAEQLGKRDLFKDYYTPLSAPGEGAWIKLLQGEPLLILLDELPPYLENAKSKMIGNSDLSVVTTTALSNLLSALGKEQLSNVCLVISDLKATYESGSELLQGTFKELENEVGRSAIDIEPVGSSSDEIFYILRKRLFAEVANNNEINEVAIGYKKAVNDARKMNLTNISAEQVYVAAKDSYPFHPSIKDLYARFKENPGFQQTRGLIRLMRKIVAQLYSGENCLAKSKYMINVFDFDLNDKRMFSVVTQINQSLTNAVSHDIAARGQAVAEQIDATYNTKVVQEVAKLILVSSLADVPHALLGLSVSEIIGDLCEPNKDITNIKKSLEEFKVKAWYLDTDRDGRVFFKNTKNMIAEMCSLVEGYSNEEAKKELRKFLKDRFTPSIKDCYQQLEIFPAIDEIQLSVDKVTLVIFEPYSGNKLHPELEKFYNNTSYQNRVMFLSGQRDTMKRLYNAIKELTAIETIIKRMRDDNVPETNQQYQIALDTHSKKMISVIQAARETFVTLYYPNKKGIATADFKMEFKENKYDGEDQITKLLKSKMKFTDDVSNDSFVKKIEDRLFTRKEMMWSEIKERAATNTAWQWHIPSALDKIKSECIKKDIWREHGSYIEKGPFEKEHTSVSIEKIRTDETTGESILRVRPKYGDKVYYEIGGMATTASMEVTDNNNFRTDELELSFLCIDSSNEHPTGEAITWTDEPKVRHKLRETASGKMLSLETNPKANIRYTTDGSNQKENGCIYEGEFIIPEGTTFVQFVAEYKGKYFTVDSIKIEKKKAIGINVDNDKKLTVLKYFSRVDTNATYEDIKSLRKVNAKVRDVVLRIENDNEDGDRWLELSLDNKTIVDLEKLEVIIDTLKSSFMEGNKSNIIFEYNIIEFDKGENFLEWIDEKKLSLSEFKESEIVQ
ncbi:MAG: DUF499 domain-containing protein, partial [Clostridium celatum]|nr:DUF499 domain-containing protein [Clostridium celatum]